MKSRVSELISLPYTNRLIIVIPTCNEEKSIGSIIKQIPRNSGLETKIVVVDKSNDNTSIIAEKAGALVVKQRSGGLGTAFRMGVEIALRLEADVLMHIDGDNQYDPREMPLLLEPILSGKVDMVLGRRVLQYKMPFIKCVGNKFFSWLISKLTGLPINDAQTGYRALNRKALNALLTLKGDYTYTQESIFIAAKRGLRICEVPISFRKRVCGRSFISLFRYPIKVIAILLHAYIREVYCNGSK